MPKVDIGQTAQRTKVIRQVVEDLTDILMKRDCARSRIRGENRYLQDNVLCQRLFVPERHHGIDTHGAPGRRPGGEQRNKQEYQGSSEKRDGVEGVESVEDPAQQT